MTVDLKDVELSPCTELELLRPTSLGPTLEDDPDTSMVQSLMLHLLSEHACFEATTMNEDDARARHEALHRHPQNHAVEDLRFRPGQAVEGLLAHCDQQAAVQRVLVPVQSVSPLS